MTPIFTHTNGKRYRWTETGALEFIDTPPAIPPAIARAEHLPVPGRKPRRFFFRKGAQS